MAGTHSMAHPSPTRPWYHTHLGVGVSLSPLVFCLLPSLDLSAGFLVMSGVSRPFLFIISVISLAGVEKRQTFDTGNMATHSPCLGTGRFDALWMTTSISVSRGTLVVRDLICGMAGALRHGC